MVLWPVLVAMAKHESHVDTNPDGVIHITLHDLAHACFQNVEQANAALGALDDAGVVWVAVEGIGMLRISLSGFAKWQTPRRSEAERKANARWGASRENLSMRPDPVPATSRPSHGDGMPDVEGDREERDTSEKAAPVSRRLDEIREVFEYWVERTSTGRGRRPLFDAKRKARIAARLADGFSVTDLKTCVDGFLLSPWHNGSESGKRYLGIETIYRDAAQVEKGNELYSPAGTAAGEDAALINSLGYGGAA